jgi:non-reducing end alpha-L-arabinofuranosidase
MNWRVCWILLGFACVPSSIAACGSSSAGGASPGAGSSSGSSMPAGDDGGSGDAAASGTGSSSGAQNSSGGSSSGNAPSSGSGSSGASGSGGSSGSSAADAGSGATEPCDIYQSGGTPCVAAHSTVRALYGSYGGSVYQVRRASDHTTKDIPVLSPGGFADSSVQDSFCSGTTCTISILYDQSSQGNDLLVSPPAHWLPDGGAEANAAAARIKVGGHTVYGIYVSAFSTNVAYRNDKTKGLATGDEPEAMYTVLDGKRSSSYCCFDYGNAETDGKDDGNATMEAIYWGSSTQWSKGGGSGPWVAADLENGMYEGNSSNTPSNTPVSFTYVTAMLKGPSGNHFTLKAGDAQAGTLLVKWDGTRPSGYSPKKLQGAIILGTGGDGSNGGAGTFFEGCMTAGNPADAIDDAVQANIVAAGYGR